MPHVAGFRGQIAGAERDASRAIYRYHQTFDGGGRQFTRKSFACVVRLAEWSDGSIRPHEETTVAGRDAHLAKIRAAKAHTEPLLCGVRDSAGEIERLLRGIEMGKPTVERTTADGTVHRLWRSHSAELIGKLRTHLAPKKLHLLEGHDLYEAMLAYRDEQGDLAQYAAANYGLAYLVPMDDSGLVSAPLHGVYSGVTATRDAILASAKQHFILDKIAGGATDVGKVFSALADNVAHQPAFVVVFANDPDAYKLTLQPQISPIALGVKVDRALAKLEPVVSEHLFAARYLTGGTRTLERDPQAALAAVGKSANVVVLKRPSTIDQIAHVDELSVRLPAGSTAFHPAIAQDLVTFPIERDEDVV